LFPRDGLLGNWQGDLPWQSVSDLKWDRDLRELVGKAGCLRIWAGIVSRPAEMSSVDSADVPFLTKSQSA